MDFVRSILRCILTELEYNHKFADPETAQPY